MLSFTGTYKDTKILSIFSNKMKVKAPVALIIKEIGLRNFTEIHKIYS